MGTGHNFSEFAPGCKVPPLGKTEKRYFSEVKNDAGDVISRRSCIQDVSTGATRYEIPDVLLDGKPTSQSYHLYLDRGSVGAPHAEWLLSKAKFRGTVNYDVFHIFNTQLDSVYVSCGSDFQKREAIVAYNVGHAPYSTQQMGLQLKAQTEKLFAGKSSQEFYYMSYPSICRDRRIPSYKVNDPLHYDTFFTELKRECDLNPIGRLSRLGRWGQFHDKQMICKPLRHVVTMPMLQMGIEKKWWPSVAKSPLNNYVLESYEILGDDPVAVIGDDGGDHGAAPAAAAAAAAPPPPAGEQPKGVKHSNECLRRLRAKHVNTIDFACHVMLDSLKMRRLDAHVFGEKHLMARFKLGVTNCKTYMGRDEWFCDLSRGGLSDDLNNMWQSLSSEEAFDFLGFSGCEYTTQAKKDEDSIIAQLSFDICVMLTYQFGIWEQEFTFGLPYYFNLLETQCEEERKTV